MSSNKIRNQIEKYILADGMSPVVDLEKSHGAWLVDKRDGREYLDLFSMTASMPVGYNHPYVVDNKVRFISSALNKPANSDIYSKEMAEFVTTMGRVAQPDYLPYAFYVEGGAMSHGSSYEAGYKFKKGKWTIKGKWEGSDSSKRDYFKSKIETELRYTFGD